jgi:hypothetical protein
MFIDSTARILLENAASTGSQTLANGTRLLGHVPHVSRLAYLHVLFPALEQRSIVELESELGRKLPATFSSFLREHNGVILFQGALAIYGQKAHYLRDASSRQPFSLVDENCVSPPAGAQRDELYIGGYDWDGSKLFMKEGDRRVYFRALGDPKVLLEWASIEEMLRSEISRLANLYDERGIEINSSVCTLPSS